MGKTRVGLRELLKIGQNINDGVKTEEQAEVFSVVNVSIYELEAHPKNFYSTKEQKEILDLKDSIELFDGVQQNLIVVKNGPQARYKYKIIAGHKRRIASEMLVEEGKKKFEYVPCRIKDNLDEIIERILLIHTNSTIHQLSDWEKTEQLKQLKELLREYKKLHKLPGRMQELLADTLNISPSQVARHERIDEKLIDEYKEEYKSGEVKFSTAAELARLPEEVQKAAHEEGIKKLDEVKKVQEEHKAGASEKKAQKDWRDVEPCEMCRIDYLPEEGQREIDKRSQQAQEQRRKAEVNWAESEESEEPEAEPAFLVIESHENPKRPQEEEPAEPGVLKIEAARFTMRILEREIEKCGIEIRYAEEQGKVAKGALAAAKIEYLNGILSIVQHDLFEMTGDDLFKE